MLLVYNVGAEMEKKQILNILGKLRKESKKRKFAQSVDLIINLKNFDIKKDSVNLMLNLPHRVKDVKIAAFLNKKSDIVNSIIKSDFEKYKNKSKVKKLVRDYDFFIAHASLMPSIASSFGRYLGPAGKMPSPQLGILRVESESEIKDAVSKFEKIIRVKSKEPSLKFCIGKESMKDEEIADNALASFNTVTSNLPRKKENVKSVMIKFTMGKPIKLEI